MKKKAALLLALSVLAAGALAAQVSVGAGGYAGGDFRGGIEMSASTSGISINDGLLKTPYFGGGGYLFLDVRYAELSFGFFGGGGTWSASGSFYGGLTSEIEILRTSLSLEALGKYPFSIGESLSVFPLLGIEYLISTKIKEKATNKERPNPGDYNALWFKLGGGLDFALSRQLYLRFEALYGLRPPNKAETDMLKVFSELLESYKLPAFEGKTKIRVGHGLTVKMALGYAF
ncbi:MAG: outer membrane beta-barrel protein [Spirochaetaceae bacterium]|jgi:opacity protein-like surface antigen|nr:outer membrane beta-barrel protein [Spirochaetaceae bacterium]